MAGVAATWQSAAMDYSAHFHREIAAFEQAARGPADGANAPLIPSCPGWTMSDLVLHDQAVLDRYFTLVPPV